MRSRWSCGWWALAGNVAEHDSPAARSDEAAAIGISRTLLSGLLASIAIMVAGLVLVAFAGTQAATRVIPLDRVVPDLLGGSRSAVLDSGILVLFATPLAGVLVACIQFARARDLEFTAITALLLVVLLAGFLVALH